MAGINDFLKDVRRVCGIVTVCGINCELRRLRPVVSSLFKICEV